MSGWPRTICSAATGHSGWLDRREPGDRLPARADQGQKLILAHIATHELGLSSSDRTAAFMIAVHRYDVRSAAIIDCRRARARACPEGRGLPPGCQGQRTGRTRARATRRKLGPACRSQLFSAYLVHLMALGAPARQPARDLRCASSCTRSSSTQTLPGRSARPPRRTPVRRAAGSTWPSPGRTAAARPEPSGRRRRRRAWYGHR